MNIYAIHIRDDETLGAGAWEAAFTFGNLDLDSIDDLIRDVRFKLKEGDGVLNNLYLYDHGFYDETDKVTRLYFGSDQISVECFRDYYTSLRYLGSLFAKTGTLYLRHCYAGKDRNLLRCFAKTMGVTVVGGSGPTKAVIDYNYGDWVTCTPNGTCTWAGHTEADTFPSATRVRVVNPQKNVKVPLAPASQPASQPAKK